MTVSSDTFVSVVARLHDDSDIVESFVSEVADVLGRHYENYEIVLVDDDSEDDTLERVRDLLDRIAYLRLIRLSRKFGEEIAITAGLDSVIGDFIVVMTPESDPPALIPEMVERARRSGGTVLGIRKRGQRSLLYRLGSALFYDYCHRILGLQLVEDSAVFRVMNRQALNAIVRIKDRLRYLRSFTAYVGYTTVDFEYEPLRRRGRLHQRNLKESIDLAISIIVANSTHPLRLVSWLGLVVGSLNLLYVGWVLVAYFLAGNLAEGWASQSIQSSLMFFFLFLILAVLCEYVGRILGEAQDRPLYFVREELSSSDLVLDAARKNVATRSTEDREPSRDLAEP